MNPGGPEEHIDNLCTVRVDSGGTGFIKEGAILDMRVISDDLRHRLISGFFLGNNSYVCLTSASPVARPGGGLRWEHRRFSPEGTFNRISKKDPERNHRP
jgi:hypothetical protein